MRLLKFSPVFLLIIFFLVPCYSFAERTIVIEDGLDERILSYDDIEILEDVNKKWTISDILSPPLQNQFKRNNYFVPLHKKKGSAYWVRVKILNRSKAKKYLFECYDQTIDRISYYLPNDSGGYTEDTAGDYFSFPNRYFQHKNFEFVINSTQKPTYYYFRFEAEHTIDLIIVIRSIQRFVFYSLNEYLLFGCFYGMIIIIGIYNLMMYLAIRDKAYVFYVLYCLSVALYAMCSDGIAFQYLWPNSPLWNQYSYGIALYLVIIFALVYTRLFLKTRINSPEIDNLIKILILVRTFWFIVCLAYPSLFRYKFIEGVPLLLMVYAGVYCLVRKRYLAARFFVVSYSVVSVGFIIKLLVFLNIIPFRIYTHYSLNISFIVEMSFLSFALADKIRIIKSAKEMVQKRIITHLEINKKLKEKVNAELEQKVRERTVELEINKKLLEESYKKLQDQSNQISEMNKILDKENWNLKKNIDEVQVSRIMNRNISFEEFKKIFPDSLSCYRYLEEIKWRGGFVCKKCKNDKYFEGAKKFSRRCTKCGYDESVTAFTLFHSIKFDINKAFYIVYLVVTERDDITVSQLSEEISLRNSTCWSFRNKAMQKINSEKAKKAREAMKDWGAVVFSDETES